MMSLAKPSGNRQSVSRQSPGAITIFAAGLNEVAMWREEHNLVVGRAGCTAFFMRSLTASLRHQWPVDASRYACHQITRHEAFDLRLHQITEAGDDVAASPREGLQSSRDHFFRRLEALRWVAALGTSDLLEVRGRRARAEREHAHALLAVFGPQRFAESEHESFRRGIDRKIGDGLEGSGRSDIDDRARVPLKHRLKIKMRERDERIDVDLNHFQLTREL